MEVLLVDNLEIGFTKDDDEAILSRSFWDEDEADCEYECFSKPIRTPRMNGFFGMDGYNCHPMQKYDK